MKKRAVFKGIHEDAFANRIKIRKYDGAVNAEIVTEIWYKLSFEDAKRFINNQEWIERNIEQGHELFEPWIKLITHEYRSATTGKTRQSWSTSLRPYVQGYGCDGSTDLNIHTIANSLAKRCGLDYPAIMVRAYPDDFSTTDELSWLQDEDVLAETIIPTEIDADLALRDLEDINNYTLAMEFGIDLYNAGVTTTNWVEIREAQELMKIQAERDVEAWFKKQGYDFSI